MAEQVTPPNIAVVVKDADEEERQSGCPLIVMIQPPSLPKITWDGNTKTCTLDWSEEKKKPQVVRRRRMMVEDEHIPNPGSDAAIKLGCLCPVLDNEHGGGIPWPREDGRDPEKFPSFYVNHKCPWHGGDVW